jgi:beta-glucosidase
MGIFADPIFLGKWPDAVVAGAGAALPPLDPKIVGSHADTYFQNHYTTNFVWGPETSAPSGGGYYKTANFSNSGYNFNTKAPVGLPSSNGWLFDYPPGLPLLQNWLHKRYPAAAFVVTENGWGNATTTAAEDTNDLIRCNYYRSYIGNMSKNAAENGIDVRGFFAWSIMDNYEWADGFSTRFGMTYVDYVTQVRTPKLSMRWFGQITKLAALPAAGQDAFPTCESLVL